MTYKLAKKDIKITTLVGTALLAALSIILKTFSIMIPLAGLPALRFGFLEIPIIISGIIYGPIAGALCGITSDILGYMIYPQGGAFFPGFTVSAALWGLIPGLVFLLLRKKKQIMKFNIINITAILGLGIGVVNVLINRDVLRIEKGILYLYEKELSLVYVILYIAMLVILMAIPVLISRGRKENIYSIDKIAFVVVISYLIISLGLNTLWLSIMFNKGFIVFLPGRILAGLIVIPLHSTIIYTLSRYFKHINN